MNDYALSKNPLETPLIPIHQPEDYEAMRIAGRLAAEILDFITPHVKPGVTTGELDRLCHDYTIERGAIPAPLNYRGFQNVLEDSIFIWKLKIMIDCSI